MLKLIDCTLRDGGHINGSNFGEKTIRSIIQNLIESNIDIIEIGFLKNQKRNNDFAIFNNISQTKEFIIQNNNTEYCLMAQEDQYDISKLENCDGSIQHIRVSFHNYDFQEGLDFAKQVIKKGYKCHINPINLQGYTDKQLIDIIDKINDIQPYTFTIVDTFGALTELDLNRIVAIIDNNLDPNISIGLHLHENLGLSFSLAQFFVNHKPPKRNVMIDGSLNGMGRVPGNLNIELIMDFLNRKLNKIYNLDPIYDAIDDYILPIKQVSPWGYSLPYALSAQHRCHRSYAEFLIGKAKLKTRDIQKILNKIEMSQKATYNKDYIHNLYIDYLCNDIDDSIDNQILKEKILKSKNILLLAPGKTIKENLANIQYYISKNKPTIISANFSPIDIGIKSDYLFFSNVQRFDNLENPHNSKIIITSNIVKNINKADYILNFRNLIANNIQPQSDNALILLLKLLQNYDIQNVTIAGFDGFIKDGVNYYNNSFIHSYSNLDIKYTDNECIKKIISNDFKDMNIKTLTLSRYINNSFMELQNYA